MVRGRQLDWVEIVARCSRTRYEQVEMLEVWIYPRPTETYLGPTRATVVPTRMHEPGFYLRAPNNVPIWASWANRDEEFLQQEFRQMVERGLVCRVHH